MLYIREHTPPSGAIVTIIVLFSRPWVAMLALGAIGHRTDTPALFLNYWTVLLAYIAARAFIGNNPISKWVAGENLNAVKKAATKETN